MLDYYPFLTVFDRQHVVREPTKKKFANYCPKIYLKYLLHGYLQGVQTHTTIYFRSGKALSM